MTSHITTAAPASCDEQAKPENPKGLSPQGASAVPNGQTPNPSPTPDAVAGVEEIERLIEELEELSTWLVFEGMPEQAAICHAAASLLTTLQAKNERLRKKIEAMEQDYVDEFGTTWNPPTAFAYAAVCKARTKYADRAESLTARVKELEAALDGERETLIKAWEALPGGQHGPRAVEAWLFNYMAPVVNKARALKESTHG